MNRLRAIARPLSLLGFGAAGTSCGSDLDRYGFPWQDTVILDHGHFKVAWCARTRNPKWVLEKLNKQTVKGPGSRQNVRFREDQLIEARFRSHPRDFKGSGFDRGHLAPAADFHCSQQAIEDSFLLSNISPQVGVGFNRDYWAHVEHFVRSLTSHPNARDVFVVTGPLFLPKLQADGKGWEMKHPMLGSAPELVAVPTHFFKVVLMELSNGANTTQAVAAFVIPNDKIDPSTPLTNFLVPIDSLECAAGMAFFPAVLTEDTRARIDVGAAQWMTGRKRIAERKRIGNGKGVMLGGTCHLCDVVKCLLPRTLSRNK
jgi:DNA/RNA endonuclease G (NUC1)